MSRFFYKGRIPASKSILNRLLVIQAYGPRLRIEGDSGAEDVVKMRGALGSLKAGAEADCGAAGTTFRFLALRAARIPGRHRLTGSRRLFERPQQELMLLLRQLGVQAEINGQTLGIESQGWKPSSGAISIPRGTSSQFASALLLNAWNLPEDLKVRFTGDPLSQGYLEMTLELVQRAGLDVEIRGDGLRVRGGGSVRPAIFEAEPDWSSAFAVAALALARRGTAEFEGWDRDSLQPDSQFPKILSEMGASVLSEPTTRTLNISASPKGNLRGIRVNLASCPDLFPVLATLCALAEGDSWLYGAPHLAHKESPRITKVAELLGQIGAEVEPRTDGLRIRGLARRFRPMMPLHFDPADDHRLAMAAAVAVAGGAVLNVRNPDVVAKSFPEFWTIAARSGSRTP